MRIEAEAGNTINLQATNITTSAVEFNSSDLSIQSANFIADDGGNQAQGAFDTTSFSVDTGSESSDDPKSYSNGQLTLSLSGNANYFIEPAALNSEPERNDASGGLDLNREEQVGQPTQANQRDRQKPELCRNPGTPQANEEQSANFGRQLGLRRQPALTIQAIQQMLTAGDQIMNDHGNDLTFTQSPSVDFFLPVVSSTDAVDSFSGLFQDRFQSQICGLKINLYD